MDMSKILKKIKIKAKIINDLDNNFKINIEVIPKPESTIFWYKNNKKIRTKDIKIDWLTTTLEAKIKEYNYTFSINEKLGSIGALGDNRPWYTSINNRKDIEKTFTKLDDLINNLRNKE